MPRYKSRATRASEVATDWRDIAEHIRDLADNNGDSAQTTKDAERITNEARAYVEEHFDVSEVEALAEEMGSWRDNMQGTALENTEKFSRVEEAADSLESIDTDSPSIDSFNDIESVADDLESRADEVEGIEFPGMYG